MPVDVEHACIFEVAIPLPALVCSSSLIGKDIDECVLPGKEDEEEGEVQSTHKGRKSRALGGFVGLETLEEALHIR
jgi:hypothetical protein